jgi:hypothetical protein
MALNISDETGYEAARVDLLRFASFTRDEVRPRDDIRWLHPRLADRRSGDIDRAVLALRAAAAECRRYLWKFCRLKAGFVAPDGVFWGPAVFGEASSGSSNGPGRKGRVKSASVYDANAYRAVRRAIVWVGRP